MRAISAVAELVITPSQPTRPVSGRYDWKLSQLEHCIVLSVYKNPFDFTSAQLQR